MCVALITSIFPGVSIMLSIDISNTKEWNDIFLGLLDRLLPTVARTTHKDFDVGEVWEGFCPLRRREAHVDPQRATVGGHLIPEKPRRQAPVGRLRIQHSRSESECILLVRKLLD